MDLYDGFVILVVIVACYFLIKGFKYFDAGVNKVITPRKKKLSDSIFKHTLYYSISGYEGFLEALKTRIEAHLKKSELIEDKDSLGFLIKDEKSFTASLDMLPSKNGLRIKILDAKGYGDMINQPEKILRIYQVMDREIKALSPSSHLSLQSTSEKEHLTTLKEDIEKHHLL